ncbi:MAG: acetyl-CoA carboxylase, biotin carboxyl carrier protein, partial [Erythrobacter sp.]
MSNDEGQGKDSKRKSGGMNIDTALVRELAELLNETGLTEIEVEDDDRKIRVSRGAVASAAPVYAAAPAPAPAAAAAPAPVAAAPSEPAAP